MKILQVENKTQFNAPIRIARCRMRLLRYKCKRVSFSELKASITAIQPCTAQLPTFSAMAMAIHSVALKKQLYTA